MIRSLVARAARAASNPASLTRKLRERPRSSRRAGCARRSARSAARSEPPKQGKTARLPTSPPARSAASPRSTRPAPASRPAPPARGRARTCGDRSRRSGRTHSAGDLERGDAALRARDDDPGISRSFLLPVSPPGNVLLAGRSLFSSRRASTSRTSGSMIRSSTAKASAHETNYG